MAELKKECRFAFHVKDHFSDKDVHLVKLQVHNEDGSLTPKVEYIPNYQRDFYIVKKGGQNHLSKKEWLDLNELNKFSSTQSKLVSNIAKGLGKGFINGGLREACSSPFVYGADINSTCLIKNDFNKKIDNITPYSNAVFDTETDVVNGTEQIVMATISFKDRVFTAVQKNFVTGYTDVDNRVKQLAEKYIGDTIKTRNIKIELSICNTEIDVVKQTMAKAHEWMPDFLSVWNLEFDMDKIINACINTNVPVEDILNDPKIPKNYRYFKFKKGAANKTTASGVLKVFKPAERWHTVFSPASFYWIDAMCSYKQIRTGQADEASYSLDNILNKHLKIGKLKFDLADQYKGLEWHQVMQTRHPLEYIVYNMFDCISMEMLDEKTLDLKLSLPMFSGNSDFQHFNSQPRRTADALHFFCLQNDKVIATTGSEMKEKLDDLTVPLSNLIVMLPSHLIADNGLKIINENKKLSTTLYSHVGDLDVSASYPNGELCFNISKETTAKELVDIENVNEEDRRLLLINLSAGATNSVQICSGLLDMPTMDMWLDNCEL